MEKGGQWFRNTLSHLVGKDCHQNWSHIGIVCFPNIKNRDFFRANQIELDEEKLKVVVIFYIYLIELSKVSNFFILACIDQGRVRGQ